MIVDRDNSFLRLRDNFDDAKDLNESAAVTHEYVGQVHLIPGETYLQITNSPTPILFNGNYEVFLVDTCDVEIEDVTSNIFIEEFTDTNAIKQISWEFLNDFEHHYTPLSLRFKNTVSDETWFTNLFITTADDVKLTTRIDYKNNGIHYGTQYNRADFFQSIRLNMYFRNRINESERAEYHEISTDVTVPQRNIRKIKERYVLDDFDGFTVDRLEILLSSNEVFINDVRHYSTVPIEFVEPEMDSNKSEHEMIVNKDDTQLFTFDFQIFEGFNIITFQPLGNYILSNLPDDVKAEFSIDVVLNTGTLTVFDASDDSVIHTYTEADMIISVGDTLAMPNLLTHVTVNGSYYIKLDAGLVSGLGIPFDGILDKTTWTFTVQDADYDSVDYSTDYLI